MPRALASGERVTAQPSLLDFCALPGYVSSTAAWWALAGVSGSEPVFHGT